MYAGMILYAKPMFESARNELSNLKQALGIELRSRPMRE
jgi:hypothetical protein